MADQAVAAESVDGSQDALADAEMDDGDDVGVESEARADEDQNAASLRCTIIPIRKRPCRRRQAEYITVRLWAVASNTLTFLSCCRAKNVAQVASRVMNFARY